MAQQLTIKNQLLRGHKAVKFVQQSGTSTTIYIRIIIVFPYIVFIKINIETFCLKTFNNSLFFI